MTFKEESLKKSRRGHALNGLDLFSGEIPGHPKGSLNPEWIELAMGYDIGWTAIEDWAMPLCQPKRGKRSCV